MPRHYTHDPRSKRYLKPNKEQLEKAIDDINKGMSYRAASAKYEIHYSVLYRHCKNPAIKAQGGQTVLSSTEEKILVQQLITCADWGYPLDYVDLRMVVKTYLDGRGKQISKFKENMPGVDFAYSFMKRHKDTLRTRICQNIKRSRAAISATDINNYFDHLYEELKDVPSSNIINYDETNLSDDPGRKKIITKRGCRYPERIMNSSKSCTSIMFAATAAGQLLPPYVVYKAQNLYESWTVGGIKGARYNRSASGWFDAVSFGDWVEKIAIPALKDLPGKKFLIGDNLSSHFSPKTVSSCLEHNISFIFLPSNSTHMTQPLDVAFFRPLKAAWRKILENWRMGAGRKAAGIPKDRFPHLLKVLHDSIEVNKEANIKAGFRKCGIYPLNRDEVLKQLPCRVEEGAEEHISNAVVDVLKSLRYADTTVVQKKRRKKVDVPAGKSVKGADFESGDEAEMDVEQFLTDELEKDTSGESEGEEDAFADNEYANEENHVVDDTVNVTFKGHIFQEVFPIVRESVRKDIWLLVAFPINKGKKEKNKFFIGQVTNPSVDNDEIEANFLRPRRTQKFSGFIYGFPKVADITNFGYDQVVGQLFPIDEDSASSSTREILRFPINAEDLD